MFKKYSSSRCYIIAEIGGNFTTLDEAKRLVDAAAECNVDAVKLQTYTADTVASKLAMFDMENTGVVSQHEIFKKYEINEALHREVFAYAEDCDLDWFSTPSHVSDVEMLEKLGVGAHKIGSDDAVNHPFLKYVAGTGKPIILSTGMCTLEEVQGSVDVMLDAGVKELILLHAITSYPTHAQHVNLKAMQTLMDTFPGLAVGYSDHTLTPVASLCAVAMGARMIERHFTYDKNADGPDHMLSADPEEMSWLVNAIREYELMQGNGKKVPAGSEETTRKNNRKSVIAMRAMASGTRLEAEDITVKRPGYGIEPGFFDALIGRTLARDVKEDAVLSWDDIEGGLKS